VIERETTVFVVDDDPSVRRGLDRLLRSAGFRVETYSSTEQFLQAGRIDGPGCRVRDIRMPGKGGLDLQQVMIDRGSLLPIIFITGHGDVPTVVRAMKGGAVDFLMKPFDDEELLAAVHQALTGKRRAPP
jgi:FixJ family two-component response regulator